ncbi:MAG: hypothetical protein MK101_12475, partial [Phycisphaerales bacterium]|nr:hypothetical protein [Phycisphaerales bacterium]
MKMRCMAGLVALVAASAAAAETITVCASGCDHTSIQDAVDAASNGDVIQVGAGIYRESIDMYNVQEVTLVGMAGPELTVIDGENIRYGILAGQNSLIEGFTIKNCAPDQKFSYGSALTSGGGGTVRNCCFVDNQNESGAAIYAWSYDSPLLIEDCTFV